MSGVSKQAAVEMAEPIVEAGATVYFKFTCERCGERCLFQEANAIYDHGVCAECGHVTENITEYGLTVMFGVGKEKS